MSTPDQRPLEVSASALWREILAEQVQLLPRAKAQELLGTLQFTLDKPSGEAMRFFIHSDGRSVALRQGEAPATPRAHVASTEAEIHAMLANPEPPKGALRVSGEYGYFVAVFEALSNQPRPTSLLKLRGGA